MQAATLAHFTGSHDDMYPGTWSADGSPQSVTAGTDHAAFPGLVRLDASRVLLVYRHGTNHLAGGDIVGKIGTLSGSSVSWGTQFTIHTDATYDVRCEDAVSIVNGQVVVAGRLYDDTGPTSFDPFILICDDAPASLSTTSTWTEVAIPLSTGADHDVVLGHVFRVGSSYGLGYSSSTSPNSGNGILKSASLTDWSSMTTVAIGASGSSPYYSEICIQPMADGDLVALLREHVASATRRSVSTDAGVTWSSPSQVHDGYGFPMFRQLADFSFLSVYRDSPDGDTAWRRSTDEGATWNTEAILDTTGARNVYASILELDSATVLCVYGVEFTGDTDADLWSQVFTRA